MKVIEQNNKRIWISSEIPMWLKILFWCFSLAILSLLFLDRSALIYIIAIGGALFMFLISVSVAETIFDIESDKIFYKYRIGRVIFRNLEVSIDTAKLTSIWVQHNPSLYLSIASGKKYRIGDFWSIKDHDLFLSNLLEHVPIAYERDF